ncbi:MAG: quinolinate synthase NadA [Actinomycetota bacterium]|jgi:quinolinate synthase|nr:quinolinate synthase NadA [Actinomycetota bacterium]
MNTKLDLAAGISQLKKEKNAVIIAHNYQIGEVQDIADFVGDSLQLSIKAAQTDSDIIVFCGVRFMAETAKILSPGRMVLLPDRYSGCPMADMINAQQLEELKQKHPEAVVVCYVNSTAEVKALSDICCTSSNAVKVVNSIDKDRPIIFIPDKYLGSYVQKQTGREMILWNGYCPTHVTISAKHIVQLKKEHLDAVVLVHPEAPPDVIEVADLVASTGGMLDYVKKSDAKEFIIGTETGIIHRMKKENPLKIFYPASPKSICPNMKLINLEKVYWALEEEQYQIELDKDVMDKARKAIDRMLAIS